MDAVTYAPLQPRISLRIARSLVFSLVRETEIRMQREMQSKTRCMDRTALSAGERLLERRGNTAHSIRAFRRVVWIRYKAVGWGRRFSNSGPGSTCPSCPAPDAPTRVGDAR